MNTISESKFEWRMRKTQIQFSYFPEAVWAVSILGENRISHSILLIIYKSQIMIKYKKVIISTYLKMHIMWIKEFLSWKAFHRCVPLIELSSYNISPVSIDQVVPSR